MSEAMNLVAPAVSILPGDERDHAFVYATWLQSYRKLSDFAKPIAREVYFPAQHDRIERLLRIGRLHVAVPEGSSGMHTILGYCVTDGALLHWVYVKGNWRQMGIAGKLLEGRGLQQFTHWTYDFDHMARRLANLKYNPYAAG